MKALTLNNSTLNNSTNVTSNRITVNLTNISSYLQTTGCKLLVMLIFSDTEIKIIKLRTKYK